MKQIERYLATTLLRHILLVLFLLVGVGLLIALLNEFRSIGRGDYGLLQAVCFVLLKLPGFVYETFPLVSLLGGLLGLGVLATGRELIIMRQAGMSLWALIGAMLKTCMLLVIILMLVGEFVVPWLNYQAQTYKTLAKSGGHVFPLQGGLWLRNDKHFIHIDRLLTGGRLQGISQYTFDNDLRLTEAMVAKQADYQQNSWQLQDVAITHFHASHNETKHIAKRPWTVSLQPEILNIMKIEPEEMNLYFLYDYIRYLKNNDLSSSGYEVAFWQRIFQPFAICVMLILALPMVLGPLRHATMGLRLVGGAVIGFSFHLLNHLFPPLSMYWQLPAVLAALVPSLLFLALASWGLSRCR